MGKARVFAFSDVRYFQNDGNILQRLVVEEGLASIRTNRVDDTFTLVFSDGSQLTLDGSRLWELDKNQIVDYIRYRRPEGAYL